MEQAQVRKQFLGVWKLVSYDWTDKASGQVSYPFGDHPVGRITYDDAGRMSAQLMRPGRKALEAADGYISYFGTFDIDEPARTVIHHVEGALIPSWVGTDLRRDYEFTGNRLILTAAEGPAVIRLVWQRDGI
jgi:hypothetical protein